MAGPAGMGMTPMAARPPARAAPGPALVEAQWQVQGVRKLLTVTIGIARTPIWRPTRTDVLDVRFSSIIFVDAPTRTRSAPGNVVGCVLKRGIILFTSIQNFENRPITFGDTLWNVKKLFENFSEPEPKLSIENSIEIYWNRKLRDLIFPDLYWILYRKFRFRFRRILK